LGLISGTAGFRALAARLRRGGSPAAGWGGSPAAGWGGRMVVPMVDAGRSYVAAALAEEVDGPIVIIVPGNARSRQLVDQLRGWLGHRRPVELFAERDALPYERIATDPITHQARLRALAALGEERDPAPGVGRPPVVVATARGLMDPLARPDEFAARTIRLRSGALSDPGGLAGQLLTAGYAPAPLVEEPGTFSRRGGILDVFPPTGQRPLRFEFFGDEIESVREFDPLTQRSREHLPEAAISPATELFVGADAGALKRLAGLDADGLAVDAADQWHRDFERISNGEAIDALPLYAGYFGRASLLDYLGPDGRLFVEEPHAVQIAVEQIEAQAAELAAEFEHKGQLPPGMARPYFVWSEIAPRIGQRDGLDLTWQAAPADEEGYAAPGKTSETSETSGAIDELTAAIRVVPPYGGRLKVVMDDVEAALAERKRVVIVTQQAPRLAELFGERNVLAAIAEGLDEPPPGGTLTLVQAGWPEGFQVVGLEGGDLVLFSDLEVFGWTKPRRPVRPRAAARDTFLSDLNVDELVVHVEHGIGRYRGLIRMTQDEVEREYLEIDYAAGDKLYVPIEQADRVSRYVGFGDVAPTLHRLGGTEWARAKSRVKAAVQELANELLELYAAREVAPGHAFAPDTVWQSELEASFPYVETPDQLGAIHEVKQDMEAPRPMDRLLCGDVGYGKTEVALRAAFKAVMDGRQVAVLVPTTVLAQQHFNTFRERMQAFPINVEMLSRFRSEREQQKVVAGLKAGSVDICIGTHRLIQKDVEFKDLGLVVIDEEQRFGVAHKERLKQLRREVDVLTLTATPIPRTLHMSLAGVRDMSTMETAPEDRLAIRTFVRPWDDATVRDAILRELDRGGQIFFVHNRVQTIYQQAQTLKKLVPEATYLVGHGQLPEEQLEKVMLQFAAGQADVLVCTTIIESGLDIPNANTIIVNHADRFGLAQLYQLRGRVGRGANRAHAYFMYRKDQVLSEVAEKRLKTIFEASELGAGFRIAMKDLEIRGAGNLLGAAQSGHASAVGLQLYTELLAEAVNELRGQPVEKRPEVSIDLPVDALLPEEYVQDEAARLSLYRRLAAVTSIDEVGQIVLELRDRYGALPERALELIWLVQLRQLAIRAGVDQIATTPGEIVLRLTREQPGRFKPLEERFRPHLRAGRSYVFLDRVGLGRRWQEVLEQVLEAIPTLAPAEYPSEGPGTRPKDGWGQPVPGTRPAERR
jgi:transcription-repair coupling factor (superfamily II helicase)